jgi:hypothetical protein
MNIRSTEALAVTNSQHVYEIRRVKIIADSTVEGQNWRQVLKRFHTRACEWKAEANMIILIARTTYAAGMGLL